MTEEVTLDDFANGTGEEDMATEIGIESNDAGTDRGAEPALDGSKMSTRTSTSLYDPEGMECAGCSDTVQRLFRTNGELRCRDCTAWSEADGA